MPAYRRLRMPRKWLHLNRSGSSPPAGLSTRFTPASRDEGRGIELAGLAVDNMLGQREHVRRNGELVKFPFNLIDNPDMTSEVMGKGSRGAVLLPPRPFA